MTLLQPIDNVVIMVKNLYVKECFTMNSTHCVNFVLDILGLLGELPLGDYQMCRKYWNLRFKYEYQNIGLTSEQS